jgi:hypothetical protein
MVGKSSSLLVQNLMLLEHHDPLPKTLSAKSIPIVIRPMGWWTIVRAPLGY